MLLTAAVIAVAVGVSLLRGGRLDNIAHADLRGLPLLVTGLLLQVGVNVAASRGQLEGREGWVLLAVSQLLVLAWIARNWHRPGMFLVLAGVLANAVVIAANGAMPVDLDAVARLGIENPQVPPGKHVALTDETLLPWLADIWALPLLRTVVSAGDVILAAGLIPLTHHLMSCRPVVDRRGGLRGQPIPAVLTRTDPSERDQARPTQQRDVPTRPHGPSDRGGGQPDL